MESPGIRAMGQNLESHMVSVLLPVFDPDPRQLRQAIDSILWQTFGELELLVVDDGSRVPIHLPCSSRIRYQRLPHKGLAATLNAGIQLAKYPWIARQDADDWSHPRRLERQLGFLWRHPDTAILGTGAMLHQRDGKSLWEAPMPRRVTRIANSSPFFHGSVVFRRQAALAVAGYCEQMGAGQDREFFSRLLQFGMGRNLHDALYHYRFQPHSITATQRPDMIRADHALLAGDARLARREYWRSIRSNPLQPVAWGKLGRAALFGMTQ